MTEDPAHAALCQCQKACRCCQCSKREGFARGSNWDRRWVPPGSAWLYIKVAPAPSLGSQAHPPSLDQLAHPRANHRQRRSPCVLLRRTARHVKQAHARKLGRVPHTLPSIRVTASTQSICRKSVRPRLGSGVSSARMQPSGPSSPSQVGAPRFMYSSCSSFDGLAQVYVLQW